MPWFEKILARAVAPPVEEREGGREEGKLSGRRGMCLMTGWWWWWWSEAWRLSQSSVWLEIRGSEDGGDWRMSFRAQCQWMAGSAQW